MAANKSIVAVFNVPGMSNQQYDKVIKELGAAGQANPKGRLYHVAAAKPNGWFVLDVWASAEEFDKFAQTLMPILQKAGVTPPKPEIYPVHNIIKG